MGACSTAQTVSPCAVGLVALKMIRLTTQCHIQGALGRAEKYSEKSPRSH